MSTEVKHRRGTTVEHSTFTGAVGEITVDTTKGTAVVHDGVTVGGFPLTKNEAAEEFLGNAATATLATAATSATTATSATSATSATTATNQSGGTVSATAITSSGAIASNSSSAGIGYSTGAGGSVTQTTSKSTTIALNKICGKITTHAASLAAGATVYFTMINSAGSEDCVIVANCVDLNYSVRAIYAYSHGFFQFALKNETSGALAQAVVINFAIIKAVKA